MIETLHLRTKVPGYVFGDLYEYGRMVWPDVPWVKGRGGSAVVRVKGATTLALQPITVGPNDGMADVVVQTNLTRLMYGDGKSLTLPPAKVGDACGRALAAIHYWLGPRTPLPWDWRVSRVDANATVELQDRDAALFLDEVGHQLWALRGKTDRPGRYSYRHAPNSTEQVALYSKTAESDLRGPNGGHLVRLEVRDFRDRARGHYGETLSDIIERGADVAKERVSTWLDRLGRQVYANPSREIVDTLILRGLSPVDAVRLSGAALILAADGLPGLIDRGVPSATAYRWAAEIRAVVKDPEAFLSETGIQLTLDDVVYADELYSEVHQ